MVSFDFTYKVTLDDLDYMNIVGHANWLILFQRARTEWCDRVGYPFTDILKDKLGIVIAGLKVKYLRPAYFEDIIIITVTPYSLFRTGIFFNCKARNKNNKFCVVADFKVVFIDASGKPVSMPEKFAKIIGYAES